MGVATGEIYTLRSASPSRSTTTWHGPSDRDHRHLGTLTTGYDATATTSLARDATSTATRLEVAGTVETSR